MANLISILRVILIFITMGLLFNFSLVSYVFALVLTIIAFALDGLDGYVARKFNEVSKLGAVIDIIGDRIVENCFWIVFAVLGWIPVAFPIIALTRSFVVDGLRSVAMEQGYTAFGDSSMQQSKVGYWICSSKFARIFYAVAKAVAFVFLIVANMPTLSNDFRGPISLIAIISAYFAIAFCVLRGLPVVLESKRLFESGSRSEA